jgi:hypothetical protein
MKKMSLEGYNETVKMASRFNGLSFSGHPLSGCRQSLLDWVDAQPVGTATPHHPGRELSEILVKRSGRVEACSVGDCDPSQFTSTVDLDASIEGLGHRLERYPQTSIYRSYEIQPIRPGEVVDLTTSSGHETTFCLTDKQGGDYFDLVVYVVSRQGEFVRVVDYSRLKGDGLVHSGDVGSLFHGIKWAAPPRDNYCVIGVVGYRKRYLRLFRDQLPCLTVANVEGKTLSVIPLNLAEAVCGNNTLALLAAVVSDRGQFRCVALSRQIGVNDVNTGANTVAVRAALKEAVENAREIVATAGSPPSGRQVPNRYSHGPPSRLEGSSELLFYEDGLPFVESRVLGRSHQTLYGGFSTGLDLYTSQGLFLEQRLATRPHERLPVFGLVKGPPAALVRCPTIDGQVSTLTDAFPLLIEGARWIQVVVSDGWNRLAASSATKACNALFVLVPRDQSISPSRDELLERLDGLNRDALAMAGPNSVVLVAIGPHLYWYRGVRWPGFFDRLPDYGCEVTELFSRERVTDWVDAGGLGGMPWPRLIELDSKEVWFSDRLFSSHQEALRELLERPLERLLDEVDALRDLVTQISITLAPDALRNWIEAFGQGLDRSIETTLVPLKEEIRQCAQASLDGSLEAKARVGSLTGQLRVKRRRFRSIVACLESVASQRASSTRVGDLKRLLRATTIKGNVARVGKMTREDQLEYIASIDNWMLVDVAPQLVPKLAYLGQSSAVTFRQAVAEGQLGPECSVGLLDRCPELDGTTVSCLVDQTRALQSHPMSGDLALALPQGSEARHRSSVPIPFLPIFLEMKSPYGVNWCELANDPSVATFRIALRSTVCQATGTRHFDISPASKELTFFLVYFFLTTAQSIVAPFSSSPEELAFDDTVCQMVRCLVGLAVSTMASGQTPACEAFTVFGKSPKPLPENEDIYVRLLARVMPYTRWPVEPFRANLRLYLVRLLRRRVTDPATDALRKRVQEIESQAQKGHLEQRNQELLFLRLAIRALYHFRDEALEGDARAVLVAQRVMEQVPPVTVESLRQGTRRIIDFFQRLSKGLDPWHAFPAVLEISTNVFTKRSACYKESKSNLRNRLETEQSYEVALARVERVSERLKAYHPSPRMQNAEAVKNCDLDRIKGDAELVRGAFTLDGSGLDREQLKSIDRYVLTGSRDSEAKAETRAPEELVPVYANSAVAALDRFGGPGLELARRLESVSLEDLRLDPGLVHLSGRGLDDFRAATETLLAGWRDNVNSEQSAYRQLGGT